MPFRLNGQYIVEGFAGGFFFTLGGMLLCCTGPRCSTSNLHHSVCAGLGIIMLDQAHNRKLGRKTRSVLYIVYVCCGCCTICWHVQFVGMYNLLAWPGIRSEPLSWLQGCRVRAAGLRLLHGVHPHQDAQLPARGGLAPHSAPWGWRVSSNTCVAA
jgi:hypothetical protein